MSNSFLGVTMVIESKNNQIFKNLKKLLQKKYRQKAKIFFVEGPLVIQEALLHYQPLEIAISEKKRTEYESLLKNISVDKIHIFKEDLFQQLADSENPQGIIGYFSFLDRSLPKLKGRFVYCDNLREPGNLGGIIRSADAFGLDGVLISPQSVEIYNPKTIRSTMASIFRIPIYLVDMEELFAQNISIMASTVQEAQNIKDIDFSENQIIVIGNEAHGVRQEILEKADIKVKIPIKSGVDSLNANVAASILIYEMTQ